MRKAVTREHEPRKITSEETILHYPFQRLIQQKLALQSFGKSNCFLSIEKSVQFIKRRISNTAFPVQLQRFGQKCQSYSLSIHTSPRISEIITILSSRARNDINKENVQVQLPEGFIEIVKIMSALVG
ncbi:MAG: hypothetical protein PHP84_12580, partial [Mesotoga sp.]|nr:hypothetical protein [Mesotoga sp.]